MRRSNETRPVSESLAVGLGVAYVLLGIAETTRAVVTGDGGVPFWFGSLVGGGALILIGTLRYRGRTGLRRALVTVGCLAGILATIWTIVLPLIAIVVVVMVFRPAPAPIE